MYRSPPGKNPTAKDVSKPWRSPIYTSSLLPNAYSRAAHFQVIRLCDKSYKEGRKIFLTNSVPLGYKHWVCWVQKLGLLVTKIGSVGYKHCVCWVQTLRVLGTNIACVGYKHCVCWLQKLRLLVTKIASVGYKHCVCWAQALRPYYFQDEPPRENSTTKHENTS